MNSQQYEQAVFISYAWGGESEEVVNQIDQALQQRGLRIIRDKRDLGYKGSIGGFMERIGQGNCVIIVISDKYLRSPNCMFELVEIAEGKQFHDRVFPIVLSNAEIYDPVKRLEYVKHWEVKLAELDKAMREVGQANLQGIREDIDQYSRIRDKVSGLTSILKDMNTLTPDLHRDSDFSEIYAGIDRRMSKALGLLKPETGDSPYMGLRYFDTSDAALFYGREALTDELLARVKKESFLAIVGASGSGKSSVARAGLIPAWKAATMGTVHLITPAARPLESLAASLTRESESVTATSTLMDDLMKDERSLRLYVRKLFSGSGESNLLLVVDQFEETFTLCKDPTERKAFIENLLSLADEAAEHAAARVVITLRADFYHHCFEYEGLRLALEKHQANIGAMTSEELREAIVKPAEQNGWDFQPRLVDLILGDVGTEPGALPLLSHALLETWKRRHGHTLTLQGYADAGGVKKAIAQTAESVYDKLSATEQNIARNIFLRLTELGEGTQDTRRRVKLDELTQTREQEAVAKVLKTLTDARLVTTEQDSAEVAHEALIREWETLRRWLDEDRENLRLNRHLAQSAQEWERRGREASELYRGTRLKRIQELSLIEDESISDLEREFITASIEHSKGEEREQKNRERILLANEFIGKASASINLRDTMQVVNEELTKVFPSIDIIIDFDSATPENNFDLKELVSYGSLSFLYQENGWRKYQLPSELMLKKKYFQLVMTPIKLRGELIGLVIVGVPTEEKFLNVDDIKFIEQCLQAFALSLETARLFEETTSRAEMDRIYHDITSKLLLNSKSVQDVLEILHQDMTLGRSPIYSFITRSNKKTQTITNEIAASTHKNLLGTGHEFLDALSKSNDLKSITTNIILESNILFHELDIKTVMVCPLHTKNTDWVMYCLFLEFDPLRNQAEVWLIRKVCSHAGSLIELIETFTKSDDES